MTEAIITGAVFAVVMILIITGFIHRTAAAAAGAVFLMITGTVDIAEAVDYIDFNTIGVLAGMMMLVAIVRCSGIFEYTAVKAVKAAGGDPWRAMAVLMAITALLSSILDNVTTVLLIGSVAVSVAGTLKADPVPFMIAQAIASNVGGTATLIGDPPNIMIGSAAHMDFMDFIMHNGPAAVMVMVVVTGCFWYIYGKNMKTDNLSIARIMKIDEKSLITDSALLIKSIVVMVITVFGFVFHGSMGIESSVIALAAASLMLLISGRDAEDAFMDIEWPVIIFFAGLFVIVGGLTETGVLDIMAEMIAGMSGESHIAAMMIILWSSALLSSTIDNIPFVATMIPLITAMGDEGMEVTPLWWALSLGACLGGNGTVVGASANVVIAGISEKNGYPITYMRFLKTGFPIMIMSIAICTVYLAVLWH